MHRERWPTAGLTPTFGLVVEEGVSWELLLAAFSVHLIGAVRWRKRQAQHAVKLAAAQTVLARRFVFDVELILFKLARRERGRPVTDAFDESCAFELDFPQPGPSPCLHRVMQSLGGVFLPSLGLTAAIGHSIVL